MKNLPSIEVQDLSFEGLPIWLGDLTNNLTIKKKAYYPILFLTAFSHIGKKFPETPSLPPEGVENRIIESFGTLPLETILSRIDTFCKTIPLLDLKPEKLWELLASHLKPSKKHSILKNPFPNSLDYAISKDIEKKESPPPIFQTPFLSSKGAEEYDRFTQKHQKEMDRLDRLNKEKRGGTACLNYYERIFAMSAHEFISNDLGDPLAADIHTFMIKHADPHFQGCDNAYYDSSHAKIARAVKRSIKTVERKISELKQKHWVCLVGPSRLAPPRCAKYQLARTPREMKHFELFMVDYKKKNHHVAP